MKFEEELRKSLGNEFIKGAKTLEKHFSIGVKDFDAVHPETVMEPSEYYPDPLSSGVNNVDFDYEMAELAKNQFRYKLATRLIAESFRGIQKSIKGGGV